MAKFKAEIPSDLIKVFNELETNAPFMMGEMCKAGATVVYNKVVRNLDKAFKRTDTLKKGLKITRVYKTSKDDAINVHIGFYGYNKDKITNQHPKGVPIPLIAMAREYGTSSGEEKKPFLRKSFAKKDIEAAMKAVQDEYIKEDK